MRRMLLFLLLVCLPLSPSRAKDTIVIASLGDSLFSGYGLKAEESFPDQLERRLKADGFNVNVINYGTSGDTTAGGESHMDRLIGLKPDIILVGIGANDMLRGMAPADTRANLDIILSRVHAAGIKMLVFGQKAPASYGKVYGGAYDPLFCELAKKYDAPCYPVFLKAAFGNPDLMQSDGMHPNAAGVKVIVDDAYPMVKKLVAP